MDEASRQDPGRQLRSGAKRLQLTCPFPEVVDKVRQAAAKTGNPSNPQVALLEIEDVPQTQASQQDRPQVATLLGLPEDEVPVLRLKWCYVRRNSQGDLLGRCPKVPSDLEAKVGYHIDTKDPSQKERVFGYLHQKTTDINCELGLKLPLGNDTYPANADEGSHFIAHCTALAIPVLPGQVQLGDAGYDVIVNYRWIRDQDGMPVIDYNPGLQALLPDNGRLCWLSHKFAGNDLDMPCWKRKKIEIMPL